MSIKASFIPRRTLPNCVNNGAFDIAHKYSGHLFCFVCVKTIELHRGYDRLPYS